jgi:hypothetical protein
VVEENINSSDVSKKTQNELGQFIREDKNEFEIWLKQISLGHLIQTFKNNSIHSKKVLALLSEDDLKNELSIKLGDRRLLMSELKKN